MPGELARVPVQVDPCLELCAVLRKLQAEDKFPAVIFEQVKGSPMPVISNIFASRKRLGLALGTDERNLIQEYLKREKELRPVVRLDKGPCQEVIRTGPDADLSIIPNITHCEKDGGPYISSGVMIVKDPDTGLANAGIYKNHIKGKQKLGVFLGQYSHAMGVLRKREKVDQPLEVVVAVGHHPAFYLASQYRPRSDISELEVAGGLMGEPLEVVRAITVDIDVPAHAEVIIEGRIPPGVREKQGPFGEYTWMVGPQRLSPVIEVSAITHRKNAIYLDIFSAHPDHNLCGVVGREAGLYRGIKATIPWLKDLVMPFCTTCRQTVFLSIKKEFDGLGKNAALAALAADLETKLAVVVDEDIDVFNEKEVLWAIGTRVQADRDIFMVPDAYVNELEPSAYSVKSRAEKGYLNVKWAIDATKPVELPFQERADLPYDLWSNLDLGKYLKE